MRFILTLLMFLAFPARTVLANTLEQDVQNYIAIFNGDEALHDKAVESLAWMGISDTRLYDILADRIEKEHAAVVRDKFGRNRVARYMRALGFSGQEKYQPVLSKYLQNGDYQRYAQDGLRDLPDHQKWNPIISNRATFNSKYSDDVNRAFNMLRSDDVRLKRLAAKRIYFELRDEDLTDMLAKEIKENYTKNSKDPYFDDMLAWMLKALGRTGNQKYIPFMREVLSQTTNEKIRRHGEQALKNLGAGS